MNELLPIILMVAVVVALAVWFYLRKKKTSEIGDRVMQIDDKRRAPSGLTLWIEDGVKITSQQIWNIEQGLNATFIKAACYGYQRAMRLSDYIIAIVKGEPDSDGNPCYRLPAGQYAGTVYDKGGYILAAGQVLAVGEPYGNIIVVPEHFEGQGEHLSLISEYEAEHVILAWNDGDKFERTKTHGDGTGHPIISDCDGGRGVSYRTRPPRYPCVVAD